VLLSIKETYSVSNLRRQGRSPNNSQRPVGDIEGRYMQKDRLETPGMARHDAKRKEGRVHEQGEGKPHRHKPWGVTREKLDGQDRRKTAVVTIEDVAVPLLE